MGQNEKIWLGTKDPGAESVLLSISNTLGKLNKPLRVLEAANNLTFEPGVPWKTDAHASDGNGSRCVGYLPPLPLNCLGSPEFRRDHRLRYAYVAGAMANGIASVELVQAVVGAGMLGFFGAAGLDLKRTEDAIQRLKASLGDKSFGINLIHSPSEPDRETNTVALYLREGINLVEAAAYLRLTLPVVRFRVTGISRNAEGEIVTPNRIIAKVSRVEIATRFFSPPPEEFLNELVRTGEITQDQARMASQIPMAQDLTAEADSAGHTDNRPLVTLLPTMISLKSRFQKQFGYKQVLRVGAGGGLSTPSSLAGAFAMGADFVVTGSVNQACVESGTSDRVRQMLTQVEQADTAMAPSADMFEMGVRVQVLKRGTMFPMRATKLYELYRTNPGMESLPLADRTMLEKQIFRTTLDAAWESTRAFFLTRDPREVERAERDPKHKMALVFRSYLGLSSRWANAGNPDRVVDYQVWCGPAMGAFNEWVRGTYMEKAENRRAANVAMNLLYGAAVQLRAQALRMQGIPLPDGMMNLPPLSPDDLNQVLQSDE